VVDDLQREHSEVRELLSALEQQLGRLAVNEQWRSSLQRLARELSDQLEQAVAAQGPADELLRFETRPPRLR
jgi:hypothetical protein